MEENPIKNVFNTVHGGKDNARGMINRLLQSISIASTVLIQLELLFLSVNDRLSLSQALQNVSFLNQIGLLLGNSSVFSMVTIESITYNKLYDGYTNSTTISGSLYISTYSNENFLLYVVIGIASFSILGILAIGLRSYMKQKANHNKIVPVNDLIPTQDHDDKNYDINHKDISASNNTTTVTTVFVPNTDNVQIKGNYVQLGSKLNMLPTYDLLRNNTNNSLSTTGNSIIGWANYVCRNCHTELSVDAVKCNRCGTERIMIPPIIQQLPTCPSCDTVRKYDDTECTKCGFQFTSQPLHTPEIPHFIY